MRRADPATDGAGLSGGRGGTPSYLEPEEASLATATAAIIAARWNGNGSAYGQRQAPELAAANGHASVGDGGLGYVNGYAGSVRVPEQVSPGSGFREPPATAAATSDGFRQFANPAPPQAVAPRPASNGPDDNGFGPGPVAAGNGWSTTDVGGLRGVVEREESTQINLASTGWGPPDMSSGGQAGVPASLYPAGSTYPSAYATSGNPGGPGNSDLPAMSDAGYSAQANSSAAGSDGGTDTDNSGRGKGRGLKGMLSGLKSMSGVAGKVSNLAERAGVEAPDVRQAGSYMASASSYVQKAADFAENPSLSGAAELAGLDIAGVADLSVGAGSVAPSLTDLVGGAAKIAEVANGGTGLADGVSALAARGLGEAIGGLPSNVTDLAEGVIGFATGTRGGAAGVNGVAGMSGAVAAVAGGADAVAGASKIVSRLSGWAKPEDYRAPESFTAPDHDIDPSTLYSVPTSPVPVSPLIPPSQPAPPSPPSPYPPAPAAYPAPTYPATASPYPPASPYAPASAPFPSTPHPDQPPSSVPYMPPARSYSAVPAGYAPVPESAYPAAESVLDGELRSFDDLSQTGSVMADLPVPEPSFPPDLLEPPTFAPIGSQLSALMDRSGPGAVADAGGGRNAEAHLPQRVPSIPDVPDFPLSYADPLTDSGIVPIADRGELSRIATFLREDSNETGSSDQGFDLNTVISAVRSVPDVRDAQLRWTSGRGPTLRVEFTDGVDAGEVTRQIARVLRETLGIAAEPNAGWLSADEATLDRPSVRPRSAPPGYGPASTAGAAAVGTASVGAAAGSRHPRPTDLRTDSGDLRSTLEHRRGRPLPRPASGPSPAADPPRLVIGHVQVTTLGVDATVEVRLARPGGTVAIGVGQGPAVDAYLLRLAATAAGDAVDQLLVDQNSGVSRGRCFIEHATVIPLAGCEVALVVLLLVCGSFSEQLCGSAIVAGDPRQAVVRATLAALNRRLESLLS